MAKELPAVPVSTDTLFSGKLTCLQHRVGYRYSIDSVLLAHFISPKAAEQILDLGAGCGIISMIVSYRWPSVSLSCLEIQENLISLIHQNRSLNNIEGQIGVIEGDLVRIKELIAAESFDRVVCNPPYGKDGCGRKNPETEQAVARHEIRATLADIVHAASFAVKNKGPVAFVYPASRAASLLSCLKGKGLEPKRLQCVYSYPGSSAKLVLVEAVKGGGEELEILPPLFIYSEPGGEYTPEMAKIYEG